MFLSAVKVKPYVHLISIDFKRASINGKLWCTANWMAPHAFAISISKPTCSTFLGFLPRVVLS